MSQGNIAGTMTKMRIYNKTVKRKIYCLFCLVMGKPHFLLCEKNGYFVRSIRWDGTNTFYTVWLI